MFLSQPTPDAVDPTIYHCYCSTTENEPYMIQCNNCKKYFHSACLKSGQASSLVGDVFFRLVCSNCNPTGEEHCTRIKLQWTQVLMLTLYNLQLQGGGKCGYYRWREHICAFIDKHWTEFFGFSRKKTSTWHGTVAGTLSAGCPQYFRSGAQELKESGWWTLANARPPTMQDLELLMSQNKAGRKSRSQSRNQTESPFKLEGLRNHSQKPAIQAAIELKERRSTMTETKELRKTLNSKVSQTSTSDRKNYHPYKSKSDSKNENKTNKKHSSASSILGMQEDLNIKEEMQDFTEVEPDPVEWCNKEESTDSWFTERDLKPEETLPQLLLKGDETMDIDVDDIEIDPGTLSPITIPSFPQVDEILTAIKSEPKDCAEEKSNSESSKLTINSEDSSKESLSDQNTSKLCESDDDSIDKTDAKDHFSSQRKQTSNKESISEEETKEPAITYLPMSIFEERHLLKQLQQMPQIVEQSPEARRLQRKLLVNQAKRERNIQPFNLDNELSKYKGLLLLNNLTNPWKCMSKAELPVSFAGDVRVLDRYQTKIYNVKGSLQQHSSFRTRLVGNDEDQLDCIISPYTARVLKPFIWRDYQTVPTKLRLLQEIVSYHHREDPCWKPPPRHPIDYCYVRPEHVPSVNALCQEFFWAGIDLSECLQYPDFSCVALYRKVVIGFAFMVPDVKYNEAYISFIFTHPEWRNAGLGKFMLYHLIQTCMGKDVTLHVSATNPALFLYQKFGFKLEEYILDFYDKYYPEDSKVCKHSFFLRLSH